MTKLMLWASRTLYDAADDVREIALSSVERSGRITEMDLALLRFAQWLDNASHVAYRVADKSAKGPE